MPTFEEYKKIFETRGVTTPTTPTKAPVGRSPAFQKYYTHFAKDQQTKEKTPEFKTNFMSWMDRLMRPAYASAGLAKEIIDPGEEFKPGEAVWKGLTGEEKTLYSDVLQTMGWQPTTKIGKFARGVSGFALDVLLDPLTYVGLGTVTKAGRMAAKTGKLAPTIAKQAGMGQRALVSFMGKPIVKGAPALKGLGKLGTGLREAPVIGSQIEKLGKAFVPGFRPMGVDINDWNKLLQVKRSATAIQRVGNEKAFKFATEVLDDLKGLTKLKKIAKVDIDNLLNAVEKRGMVAGLPDSVKPIWGKLVNYADDVAKRRKGIGKFLLDDTDYNYWLHTLSEAERAKLKRMGLDVSMRDWTTHSISDIHRQYVKIAGQIKKVPLSQQKKLLKQGVKIEQASIGEINKALGKELFSTDIPFTAYQMGRRLSRQEAGTTFFKSVRELGSSEAIEGWVKSTAPELKDLYFNPHIKQEIDALRKVFIGEELTQGFVKTFDTGQNFWKKWTLGPFPAYHFRNMIGNTWNNYLAGVVDPTVYTKAASIQRRVHTKAKLTPWEQKIIQRAEGLGVLERGWFKTVLGSEAPPSMTKRAGQWAIKPAEAGLKVGRQIENNARLAHFIDKVNKGWNFDEAAMSVKKYLFDYTELTPFEMNVMRRLMPFYTWSRKNVPLQIEHIIKRPGKTIAPVEKARRELAVGKEPERKYLPEWLQERYPFRVGKPEKGVARYFPLESWLPIADVGKLARPGQAIAELISPAFKLPTELLMNRSFYFEKPIQKYPGERKKFLGLDIPAKTEYSLRNIRLLSEVNRLFQKPKPTGIEITKIDKAVRFFTGIKTYPQRITEMKRWFKYNIDKQVFELKKGYNRARRNNNLDEARRIKQKINRLERIKTD